MVIPQGINNPYGDIGCINVLLLKKLVGISTNDDLKYSSETHISNYGYIKTYLLTAPHNAISGVSFICFFIVAPDKKRSQHGWHSPNKENQLHLTDRFDLRIHLSNLMPNVNILLLKNQVLYFIR